VGSINGVVIDAATKAPVAAARVMLVGAHQEELSHNDGKFHFDRVAPGRHTIRIERLGYTIVTREVLVTARTASQLKIELPPSALEVAPLVVTGTMTRRRAEEMLSSTTAMHAQQLDRNANPTIAQMIEKQPGVSVSSVGPATARPIIRGLGGDRILLLEDGQRPGDMSANSGDHAVAIEPLTASQIEVVRGPMSLLYGSSAMGGVVNVVKHDIPESLPEHAYGQASFEAGSAQPGAAVGGSIVTGVARFATRFEGSARFAGDVRTPIGTLGNTSLNAYNASVGFGRGGEWGHGGASYRFYSNHYGIPAHEHEDAEEGEEHIESVDIEMLRHTLHAETEFHREGGLLSSIKLSALGTHYQHTEMEAEGGIGTEFEQRTASFEAGTRVDEEAKVAAAVGMRAQFREIETGGSLSTPSTRDYTLAGYAVSEFGGGNTRYQAGVRYDWARYEPKEESFIFVGGQLVPTRARDFGSFSGSIGMLHELNETTRLGVNLSRAYRTPDFNELYSNGPHLAANSIDVGDPNIDHETGLGGDIFIRRTGEHVRFETSFFVMWLDNYIFPSSRGRAELGSTELPRFQHTNEDARFIGGEAQFAVQLTDKWAVEANASYVAAEFTSNRDSIPVFEAGDTTFVAASKYPPLIPPLNGIAALRYSADRRTASAEVKWAADATRLGDFETTTAGYAILNLTAGIQLMVASRLHSVTFRIDNVFDREYRNHLSRIKDVMPQPGRNFALMYRVTI
jgi:iron complex outermembrane receptor protein